ncbi:hypothetical protein [Luteibacter jiangsuensis]|uniref:hypothetical protein n=1 Tax=Luteibacter jiangsuensis TaxID=637577 RepID=UPI003CCE20CB
MRSSPRLPGHRCPGCRSGAFLPGTDSGKEAQSMNHELQRQLQDAAWDGDHLSVAALIDHPEVDPAGQHSAALLHTAHRGHLRCVELLLPVSDPNARRSEALQRAAKGRKPGHLRCLRLLARWSDTTSWETWEWDALPNWSREALAHRRADAVAGAAAGP